LFTKRKLHIVFATAVIFVLLIASFAPIAIASALAENTTFRWVKVNQNGFGSDLIKQIFALEEYKGELYAGANTTDGTIALWKSSNGSQWTKVNQPIPGLAPGEKKPHEIMDLHVFKEYLYVGTAWIYPAEVWRTANGTVWERIVDPDFGETIDMFPVFITYKDNLYLSNYNKIFVSPSGNSGTWTVSHQPITPATEGIWSMGVFNKKLYAGGINENGGVIIYRLDGESATPTVWEQVNTPGFGKPENTEIGGFAVFQNALYVGTRNDSNGGEIWKMSADENWTKVSDKGFGDLNNVKVEGIITFDNTLFVAVNNNSTGLQIWSTTNGSTWTKVKDARYDPPRNSLTHWNNAFTIFQNRLYIGTLNKFLGGEIWAYPGYAIFLPIIRR
jgi:hypothetical protein